MASQGLPAVSWVQLMFVSAQISEPPIPFGTGQSTHRIFLKINVRMLLIRGKGDL